MPFSALLVVLSTLAAPGAAPEQQPIAVADVALADAPSQGPGNVTTQPPRPHRLGLGGSLGLSNRGGAGAVRYWFGSRVGVDFTAGYYRGSTGSTIQTSSVQVAPSVIVMLTEPLLSADVDVRPYVGAGAGYVRASSSLRNDPSTRSHASGTGMQAFGGVEMTFQDSRNLAISAEMGYYRQPVRFSGVPANDGVDVRVYVHIYLR